MVLTKTILNIFLESGRMYINIRKNITVRVFMLNASQDMSLRWYVTFFCILHAPQSSLKTGQILHNILQTPKDSFYCRGSSLKMSRTHLYPTFPQDHCSFDRKWSWNQRSYQLRQRQIMLLKPVLFLILYPDSQNQRAHWLQFSHFIKDTETQREVTSLGAYILGSWLSWKVKPKSVRFPVLRCQDCF